MKKISLIALNKPGLASALATVQDLLQINSDFDIKIYSKNDRDKGELASNHKLVCFSKIDDFLKELWQESDAIIWFCATGIVVRKIAGLLNSKTTDPAVLVMNFERTQVIPLLSSHLGGAAELAQSLKLIKTDLNVFTTTGTDSLGVFAFDSFAKDYGFEILNIENLAKVSNSLINNEPVNLVTYPAVIDLVHSLGLNVDNIKAYNLCADLTQINKDYPTVITSPFEFFEEQESFCHLLNIKIKSVNLGIGLNRDTSASELERDIKDFLYKNNLNLDNIKAFASFEAKSDEKGLIELAHKYNKNLLFFNKEQINALEQEFSESKATKFFEIKGVAEPSAVLASEFKTLFIKKHIYKNTTIAAAF